MREIDSSSLIVKQSIQSHWQWDMDTEKDKKLRPLTASICKVEKVYNDHHHLIVLPNNCLVLIQASCM